MVLSEKAALCDQDIVAEVEDDRAGTMYALSEAGKIKSVTWQEERKAQDDAFVDALSEEELSQLADLLTKVLSSSAHERAMR